MYEHQWPQQVPVWTRITTISTCLNTNDRNKYLYERESSQKVPVWTPMTAISTCMNTNAYLKFLARFVRNLEQFRFLNDVQWEVGDLDHMTLAITSGQTTAHHVRVTNRLYLRTDRKLMLLKKLSLGNHCWRTPVDAASPEYVGAYTMRLHLQAGFLLF